MELETQKLKYPIGQFDNHHIFDQSSRDKYIKVLHDFPSKVRLETFALLDWQLDTPYRDGGWTIRQVVHHCADSHMNCLTRFKLALTEQTPTIKPYDEALWAELGDSKMPINAALKMIEGIHERWVVLLKSLSMDEFKRSFIHPVHNKEIPLDEALGFYAWHCDHHLAHIVNLKTAKGWK